MNIKIIYLISICIGLIFYNCNSQHIATNKSDCVSKLKNNSKSFDTSKVIDDYLRDVTSFVYNLKKIDLKGIYNNCTKTEIMKYYLNEHSMIDSVMVTPSEHGISFFRKDENVWANLLIE